MTRLTHFNSRGDAHMVDVSDKAMTHRTAIAEGFIRMQASTLELILTGGHKKGDVLGIARVAGIMAAKKTADLIPLCHPLSLSHIEIDFETSPSDLSIRCQSQVECKGQTGVEMEALQAVQTALLTIYDMCKAVDRGMTIESIGLLEKTGGQSGTWKKNKS